MSTPFSVRDALRAAGLGDGPHRVLRDLGLASPIRLRAALERAGAAPEPSLPPGVVALRVGAQELRKAVRERLAGSTGAHSVVWTRDASELVVHAASIELRVTGGFMVATLEVEALEVPRMPVRLVYFLGTAQAGAGKAASVTHDGETPPAVIEAWGEPLRLAVWEGVLDVIEGAAVAASQAAGVPLRVLGFTGGEDRVQIAVGL